MSNNNSIAIHLSTNGANNSAVMDLISEEDVKRWETEKWQKQYRVLTESQAIEEMREIFKHSLDGDITGRRQLLSDLKGQCPTITDFQFEKLWKSVVDESWTYHGKRSLKKIAETTSLPTRENRIKEIAARFDKSAKEIREALTAYIAEEDAKENQADTLKELDQILNATKSRIDLSSVIPENLAKPINLLASTLNLRPECYLTTMLSVTSSLFKTGTTVRLIDCTNFKVVPNLFGAIVAVPSQGKSPILKAIANEPLRRLQEKVDREYSQAFKDYEEEVAEYNKLSEEEQKEQGKPTPPPNRKRVLSYTKATSEAVREQYAAHPECGLLNLVDELKGAFSSFNMYRKGKGSDEEDLLSLYDGVGETVLRADAKKCADLPDDLIYSVMGGIQPDTLQKLLEDCRDGNGKWGRFNFVLQPLAASEIHHDSGRWDLTPLLAGLYEKIDDLPAKTYHLSVEAKKYFLKARNHAELKRVEETRPGMQVVWGKVPGKLGKLAVNLHVIWELMHDRTPSQEIPLDRMKAAVQLAKFYVSQVESLYVEFASTDELAPGLAKIIEISERQGWVKARQIQQGLSKKTKADTSTIRAWFQELVDMGKGAVKGAGSKLEFKAGEKSSTKSTESTLSSKPYVESILAVDEFVDEQSTVSEESTTLPPAIDWDEIERKVTSQAVSESVDFVDKESTLSSTAKTLTEQGLEGNVDFVDFVDSFPTPPTELKVGDRVLVTRKASCPDSPLARQLAKTRNATVVNIDDQGEYELEFDNGVRFACGFKASELEPIRTVEAYQPSLFDSESSSASR